MAGFAAIFSYSFLVSLHCAGMCGPLACSVLARTKKVSLSAIFLYNGGRLISYVGAGALFGLLSVGITQFSLDFGLYLARAAGVLLILWAILPALPWHQLFKDFPQAWLNHWQTRILAWPLGMQALGLGLLTVLLPCMTLHPLLLASIGSGSAISGGLTMFAFFLGTLPAMLAATYVPALITARLPTRLFSNLGRGMLFIAGIITIWRTL